MGFDGEIKGTTLPDIIQMACLEGRHRVLEIESSGARGQIYFSNGEIVHAKTQSKEGTDAFFQMMGWHKGRFLLKRGQTTSRTIDMPWNFLLIEGQRQIDESSGGEQQKGEDSRPLKIMIVDDSRMALNALKKVIEEISPGHDFLEARNGKDALEKIKSHRPDLVTLDASMPVMDGDLTLMHIMVRSPAPVALISGLDRSKVQKIMDFFRLGAIDFIPKPSAYQDWSLVKARLARIINVARQLKVHQVRRAKRPRSFGAITISEGEAQNLVVIIGGLGGVLELQKMITSLKRPMKNTAFVAIQDMVPDLVSPLGTYLEWHSPLTSVTAAGGTRILAMDLVLSTWDFTWELQGQILRRSLQRGAPEETVQRFLVSCAKRFEERLALFILTGTTMDLEDGLMEVASRGGHVYIQDPATCLHPAPVLRIKAYEIEEGEFDTEEFGRLLGKVLPDTVT